MREGRAVQEILSADNFKLAHLDLSGVEEGRREGCADRAAAKGLPTIAFDLAEDLPQASLIRLAAGQHVLAGVVHHIAFDGWSSGVFLRELAALYTAFIENRPAPLTPLTLQYADVALWQRRLYADPHGSSAGDLAYWRTILAAAPELLDLPTDRPRSAMRPTPRRTSADCTRSRAGRKSQGACASSWRELVHGASRWLRALAIPLERAIRHPDWDADRQPHATSNRGSRRFLL